MTTDLETTLRELTELASSLSSELETTLMEKSAAETEVQKLTQEITKLKKQAEVHGQERVILEKVASHGIASPSLIPILGKLEKAGFIKAGSSMTAYASIKSRPDYLVDLIASIADSFAENFSEAQIEKSASTPPLPTDNNTGAYVDVDNWSRIIKEGA